LQGDIMVPVVGENTVVGRHVITNVTLAMLEDTGWYVCFHPLLHIGAMRAVLLLIAW
jgi:hypothetical protein